MIFPNGFTTSICWGTLSEPCLLVRTFQLTLLVENLQFLSALNCLLFITILSEYLISVFLFTANISFFKTLFQYLSHLSQKYLIVVEYFQLMQVPCIDRNNWILNPIKFHLSRSWKAVWFQIYTLYIDQIHNNWSLFSTTKTSFLYLILHRKTPVCNRLTCKLLSDIKKLQDNFWIIMVSGYFHVIDNFPYIKTPKINSYWQGMLVTRCIMIFVYLGIKQLISSKYHK